MALSDYYLCDICGNNCFCDSDLNYEYPDRDGNDYYGDLIKKEDMIRGKDYKLGYVGDMKVICNDCSLTHEVMIRKINDE